MNDVRHRPDGAAIRHLHAADVRARAPLRQRVLAIAIVLLAAAALVWWIQSRPAPPTPAGRLSAGGPVPVVAASAQKRDINITLNALGTVTPLATVTIKSPISGQIMRIAFQEGQKVSRGDFLAEIDSRPYERQLAQAQGQLLHDQALLKNAEIDLARYRKLAVQDSIPRQQLDTQEYLVHQYEGTVKSDQAMVDTANLNIAYCHVVAPISGQVGLRQVDQGNYVQANDTNGMVVITQTQPITVVFTLPEDDLPAVLKRLHAGAAMPVAAYDRSYSTRLATGRLMTTDNQIDPTTGTVKLKAQFDNDDESLFPNQFVNVHLLVDVQQDALVIPSAAVQRGAPGTFVYAITPEDTVILRPVTLGASEGERVAVRSGLAEGDRIVVDGTDKLRDGAKISLGAARATTPAVSGSGQRHQSRAGSP